MSGKSGGDGPVTKGQHSVFRTKKKESNAAAELPYGGDQFDNTDFRWATRTNEECVHQWNKSMSTRTCGGDHFDGADLRFAPLMTDESREQSVGRG